VTQRMSAGGHARALCRGPVEPRPLGRRRAARLAAIRAVPAGAGRAAHAAERPLALAIRGARRSAANPDPSPRPRRQPPTRACRGLTRAAAARAALRAEHARLAADDVAVAPPAGPPNFRRPVHLRHRPARAAAALPADGAAQPLPDTAARHAAARHHAGVVGLRARAPPGARTPPSDSNAPRPPPARAVVLRRS
jgi:hypothetical protein